MGVGAPSTDRSNYRNTKREGGPRNERWNTTHSVTRRDTRYREIDSVRAQRLEIGRAVRNWDPARHNDSSPNSGKNKFQSLDNRDSDPRHSCDGNPVRTHLQILRGRIHQEL